MRVVGHQDVRMDRARMERRQLPQMVEIASVVVIDEKAGAAIVPTLDDVQWGIGNAQAARRGMTSIWGPLDRPSNAPAAVRFTNRGLSPVSGFRAGCCSTSRRRLPLP